MEAVVVALHPLPTRAVGPLRPGTDAEWLAMRPVQKRDGANRHARFGFMTSIWCGAMVGGDYAAMRPMTSRRPQALPPLRQNETNPSLVEMRMRNSRQWLTLVATTVALAAVASPADAQNKYDPGASDREIKIGNTMAYSGQASAYGEIGKTFAAYFNKINAEGGINGRRSHADVGCRLVACFEEAGLPTPHMIWESIAGGPASPVWRWLAMSYGCMLPHMARLGLRPADTGDPDTLADRLVAAATAVRAQIVSPPQACAWATRP
jgi:hypothetical protein